MALAMNCSVVLKPSSPINGAALKSFSSNQNPNHLGRLKLHRKALAIRATSSVQQHQADAQTQVSNSTSLDFIGVHHVGVLCQSVERSLEFYQGVLGLQLNPDRPDDKLPYGGAWLWVGAEMIHLMELPNPDPTTGRPAHGGRDRHACVAIKSLEPLVSALEKAGVPYTLSQSGRPALFARDPDGNCLEFTQA